MVIVLVVIHLQQKHCCFRFFDTNNVNNDSWAHMLLIIWKNNYIINDYLSIYLSLLQMIDFGLVVGLTTLRSDITVSPTANKM